MARRDAFVEERPLDSWSLQTQRVPLSLQVSGLFFAASAANNSESIKRPDLQLCINKGGCAAFANDQKGNLSFIFLHYLDFFGGPGRLR